MIKHSAFNASSIVLRDILAAIFYWPFRASLRSRPETAPLKWQLPLYKRMCGDSNVLKWDGRYRLQIIRDSRGPGHPRLTKLTPAGAALAL